jgi:CheY-like chemotaxis protein/anti-sigma regulatory factor (Ser/Thr protein kinase)
MLRANDKKIALTAAIDPDLPAMYTDEVRLLQILNNLLSNAVKFTQRGGVTLTGRLAGERVVITVQDTGIGVAAEDLPKLFMEFYQTETGRDRKYEGTGLGLAITKRLSEALGGSITVASELGVGSTFTVTLPLVAPGAEGEAAAAAATRAAEAAAAALRTVEGQATILVIDDDPGTHVLVAENLKPLGARFLAASTGVAGLATARAERPDLILLDVRLPDRQGWEVLHDLKADPATQDIPVIVVSVVDRESLGFSLGAADYIVKPVNWDQLYKVLGRLGFVPALGDVLVVDDDTEQVSLLQRALESRGFTVRTAADGTQALARAREQRPGLILLDLMMPVMDGFDTLTHLRRDPKTADVPVLVLTAKDLTDDDRARLGGKVSALLQKQRVPLDQLIAEVRARISKASPA